MKILVLGSGGREHALIWKLHQSPSVEKIFCAPGNPGIEQFAASVPLQANDVRGLLKFAQEEKIDLTVVGPEQPLVDGIVDVFEQHGLKIFGPGKAAAQLEGSKVFSKDFMERHHIPTAKYRSFARTDMEQALAYIEHHPLPVVIKADGLAAGKGVLICNSLQEAKRALEELMQKNIFGTAGDRVVVEEFLTGEEASVFVLTDGDQFTVLAPAQDHKRILDNDLGKNTGGMGAYAPAPAVTFDVLQRTIQEIIRPTLDGMKQESMPYRGCLFIGLILTANGPKTLEYNCRFGDPETQVVVPLIDGDLAEIFLSIAERRFKPAMVKQHNACAVCVVMASQGYPDEYSTGKEILGLDHFKPEDGTVVFQAGTKHRHASIVTAGGRVLGVTAVGYRNELENTIRAAYKGVEQISFDGAYYRSDIGKKALGHLHPQH
jgi:phosphoribosylamine---glycine ligase